MRVRDLSHTIRAGMPVYPGTEPPLIENPVSLENDGFLEKKLTLYSHTGTHVDAPAHMIADALTLDRFEVGHFIGRAYVVDVSALPDPEIKIENLIPYTQKFRESEFILFFSGWSAFWGSEAYFIDYPLLSKEAAGWLCQFDLKGIGIDMISFDPVDSVDMPVHHILLSREFILIENLTNLAGLRQTSFTFSCLPLKIESADGAPIRAVAVLS
jgi:arylformamidase